jgi:hypothetical protein
MLCKLKNKKRVVSINMQEECAKYWPLLKQGVDSHEVKILA